MSRIFDNSGRYLGDSGDFSFAPSGRGHLGDASTDPNAPADTPPPAAAPSTSFGAALFEFFHPQQVQAEYAAVGKDAPAVTDIMGQAITDMGDFASAGVTDVVTGAQSAAANLEALVKVALVAGILAGGFIIYQKFKR